eukprot:TRINITY_DN61363_c0_g1_i1.p2 TRINITY_DN61363_c0_g1~~TRINITY_DN61363_c0_g1_i1.p2  ORF type:complete len:158 (+),score=13.69 TRINITY_DN61363_c0_g1_i1:83-556(+)
MRDAVRMSGAGGAGAEGGGGRAAQADARAGVLVIIVALAAHAKALLHRAVLLLWVLQPRAPAQEAVPTRARGAEQESTPRCAKPARDADGRGEAERAQKSPDRASLLGSGTCSQASCPLLSSGEVSHDPSVRPDPLSRSGHLVESAVSRSGGQADPV